MKKANSVYWFTLISAFLFGGIIWGLFNPSFVAALTQISFTPMSTQSIYIPIVVIPESESGMDDTFYISPNGNDALSGRSPAQAWATFDRAWNDIYPGDTLILLDGIYYQSLNPNIRNGEPGSPITIRAQNDGQAIIDGQNQRVPVKLGNTWPGPIGNYFVIEGIVARNSNGFVIVIDGARHNILRRVSAYNANSDTNSAVIGVIWPSAQHNLIEDCVAAGSGRKMLYTFQGEHNIFRRCFTSWQEWDGRNWHDCWPWGDGIELYNASHNIIENSISYGPNPTAAISILANHPAATNIGNQILGSMAIGAGMQESGEPMNWGSVRPQPTEYSCVRDFNWPSQRVGFMVYGQGEISDNLWQDIFSWGNAGLGLSINAGTSFHPNTGNNRINRATIANNGLDNPHGPWPGIYGGVNTDVRQVELSRFNPVQNSHIEQIFLDWPSYPAGVRNMTSMNGEGARLTHRYVNGALTNEPLWPWPMEARIQAELGISVTNLITDIISETNQQQSASRSGNR